MDGPTGLVAAGNTYNPSLLVLKARGYELWVEEGADRVLYCAAKGCRQFTAFSPPELLGITALWEEFGESWNRQSPNLLCDLLGEGSE